MDKIRMMKLSFDFHKMDFDVDFPLIDKDNLLEDVYKEIGCSCIDIVNIDDVYTAIVDDVGLMVGGNPVFEIQEGYHLAGKVLIGTSEMTDDGMDIKELGVEKAYDFLRRYDVKLIGKTS